MQLSIQIKTAIFESQIKILFNSKLKFLGIKIKASLNRK